ncbi:ATP-binding protein [Gynuella sunshinyii]|uniref:histidine kinase n=1 Tax=Gynuella sunshinyii YC6258 TaxID=1445510 RepID=A0A0C5VTR6_9GAMM|nr:ATP-binding protein [Gynuella sunshinyii]AJQ96693.1 signal transduction histidine kinase [Gynuella sunshinyii YC6258]
MTTEEYFPSSQKILKVRRHYNQWVANQTLEDFALRFTARKGRHMSIERVGSTALGATAFLALEGIAATVTLSYGFINTVIAMVVVCLLFFITGFPITYYSAKHGLDIDLLTRGAGFGYLGSTITSLIYASFTFIFFAIEAAILASALQALFGIPLAVGYFLCAVAVIPIVMKGISAISRFQIGTQGLWLILQCSALAVTVIFDWNSLDDWADFAPVQTPGSDHFDILLFGAAASVFFAMVAQIGEQVDYLRFMPAKTLKNRRRWWFWLILAGPGWVLVGMIKMLLGSFLAYLAVSQGATLAEASDPTRMYQQVFGYLIHSEYGALVLAALMVIISQMKINLTNAYAGSIAWSNFFSRLTHSHPGRVVWLVFNVALSLLLMELGMYRALEAILGVFAIVAVSWLGSLSADLLINKPLGLSPATVEFKRAHLYDINPVGTGSMLLATLTGMICYLGVFGEIAKQLCHFASLGVCFICVPLIAWLTQGRYYLARQSPELIPIIRSTSSPAEPDIGCVITCGICQNEFESEDMSFCSVYAQPICSLCCSLDVRCLDSCKPHARISHQMVDFLELFLPATAVRWLNSRLGRFAGLLIVVNLLNISVLAVIYRHMQPDTPQAAQLLQQMIWILFVVMMIVTGVVSWLFLLAHESRLVAQQESNRQTQKLTREIQAHEKTDRALQQAKELAEQASMAKSRYLTGISHELRTPLQSILGYAQLLADKKDTPIGHQQGLKIIQRSGRYLADLIEGLLDISKIEAGRLDLNLSQVALPELIEQLEHMFAMQASSKQIGFVCRIHNPLPTLVKTDEKRLRQILINLLSNAIKYTTQGQVVFDIHYRNQVAEFSIVDSGPGISPEQQQRIFEPFERIRNIETPNVPGTGLGLTIVKLLTDIMGGDVQLESEPGKGSCFKVSLMLPWLNAQTVEPARRVIQGYRGRRRCICLVDDDPVVRGFLSDLLMPFGFTILEAHNASSCLTMLEQLIPDLFILDVSMPAVDGLELAGILRNRSIAAPVIMLSANARIPSVAEAGKRLYDAYLVKPIGTTELLDKIAECLALEWIYQTDTREEQPNPAVTGMIPDEIVIPDSELIRQLKSYAELGYPKGVNQVLAEMAENALVPVELQRHLEQLSAHFQFEQLIRTLE